MNPAKYGLRPSKSLGQNFINDGNVLDGIVEGAGIKGEDLVFEIGPGLGVLTDRLADAAARTHFKRICDFRAALLAVRQAP